MTSTNKIILKSAVLTIAIFAFSLPLWAIQSKPAKATITYTKVGEIEEDSDFNAPYIGMAKTIAECTNISNKKTCHIDIGKVVVYRERHAWRSPKNKGSGHNYAWHNLNFTVSQDLDDNDPKTYQKICVIAKDVTKSIVPDSITIDMSGYQDDVNVSIAHVYTRNISKKKFKAYCAEYRLIKPTSKLGLSLDVFPSNAIAIDKIILYQGGTGPSIIDEIAAHPFDTGTK